MFGDKSLVDKSDVVNIWCRRLINNGGGVTACVSSPTVSFCLSDPGVFDRVLVFLGSYR